MNMDIVAEAKNIRMGPRKVRLVAKDLRGKNPEQALESLKYSAKASALPLSKVIKSAMSNATNNLKLDSKDLVIKEVRVNEGATLKRFQPRSRGMAHPVLKRTSHIKVILEGKA
jgi:large subunit ribosomal protein L22